MRGIFLMISRSVAGLRSVFGSVRFRGVAKPVGSWFTRNSKVLWASGVSSATATTIAFALGRFLHNGKNDVGAAYEGDNCGCPSTSPDGFSVLGRDEDNLRVEALSKAISCLRALQANENFLENTQLQTRVIELYVNLGIAIRHTKDEEVQSTHFRMARHLSGMAFFGLVPTTFDRPMTLIHILGGKGEIDAELTEDCLSQMVDLSVAGVNLTSFG